MKPRRTNQERSATTQAAILDATIEQLAEHGYGRTTTVEVAERAGVSRGALVHHFSTRSDLVLAALEYLCERRLEELEAGIARLSATATAARPSAFVDLMWSTFEGPLFTAQLELWMAARADADLFERLYPLERGFGKRLSELCTEALGDGAGPFYELTKHLMRGMAVERLLKSDERERNDVLARWKVMATTTVPSATRQRRRS